MRQRAKAGAQFRRGNAQPSCLSPNNRGKAWSWNAVSEAIKPEDGQPLGPRLCWPAQQIGPDYIDLTFRAARTADPQAVLAYNDSQFELATPAQENRRTALLYLLDDLHRRQTPIDAVGLQSHLRWNEFTAFEARRHRAFLAEIASRGLKVIISELDVLDVGVLSDVGRRDRMVADVYDQFLEVALDKPAVKATVTWGLSNRYSWLNPNNDPTFVRPHGLATRPFPSTATCNLRRPFTRC